MYFIKSVLENVLKCRDMENLNDRYHIYIET